MSFFARVSISLLMITASVSAMKREVPEGGEAQEAKIARVSFPLSPELQQLPDELLKLIIGHLTVAKGATETAALYKAAESIRSLLMTSSLFTKYLNDIDFNGALILELARRYTNNNIIEAAVALGTQAGGAWLNKRILNEVDEHLKSRYLGSVIPAIFQAVSQGKVGVARFLFYYYPDLKNRIEHTYDAGGKTLLLIAVGNNHFNIVKLLIEAGGECKWLIKTSSAEPTGIKPNQSGYRPGSSHF